VFELNNTSGRIDIIVNNERVGEQVRNETVGGYASKVAVFPEVRQALLQLQKDMATRSGLVADGRDPVVIDGNNSTCDNRATLDI
jgi:cytidylate kinase